MISYWGEDVFTAAQKRAIRRSVYSYELKRNDFDPTKINVLVCYKKNNGHKVYSLIGHDLNKVITDLYKIVAFVMTCEMSKKIIRQSNSDYIINTLKLKRSEPSMFSMKINGMYYGLSHIDVINTKTHDLYSVFKMTNELYGKNLRLGLVV